MPHQSASLQPGASECSGPNHSQYHHSFITGQNMGLGQESFADLIMEWFNEIDLFTYGKKSEMSFGLVGHFTQVGLSHHRTFLLS